MQLSVVLVLISVRTFGCNIQMSGRMKFLRKLAYLMQLLGRHSVVERNVTLHKENTLVLRLKKSTNEINCIE